jgi:hypothetical protein
MTVLTDSELRALRNLASKGGGSITPFLNIADAQRLTELGLAQRTQQGWEITPSGAAHLAPDSPGERTDGVLDFKRNDKHDD